MDGHCLAAGTYSNQPTNLHAISYRRQCGQNMNIKKIDAKTCYYKCLLYLPFLLFFNANNEHIISRGSEAMMVHGMRGDETKRKKRQWVVQRERSWTRKKAIWFNSFFFSSSRFFFVECRLMMQLQATAVDCLIAVVSRSMVCCAANESIGIRHIAP